MNKENVKFVLALLLFFIPVLNEEVKKYPSLTWASVGFGAIMTLMTDARGVFLIKNILNFALPKKTTIEEKNSFYHDKTKKQVLAERTVNEELLRAEKALKTVPPGSISVGDKIAVLSLEKFISAVGSSVRIMGDELTSKFEKARDEWINDFVLEVANQARREYPQEIVDLDIYRLKTTDQKTDREIPSPLDGKVNGILFKNKDGQQIPANEFIVFRPQDDAFFAVLPAYLSACKNLGADDVQIDAVRRLINKIADWRKNHPERCKTPDCQPGETPDGW